jgi:ketosteroid isomerase-like protein
MKAVISVCLTLLAASIVVARQYDSRVDANESRILTLENAWNQAEQHKDTKVLDELLSSTLVYIDYDGTFMDKAEFLASVQSPANHPEQIVNDSASVHTYGNSAVVTGVYREKGTNNGKSYQRRGRFTDTWVSQNGVWQCVASQSTLITSK